MLSAQHLEIEGSPGRALAESVEGLQERLRFMTTEAAKRSVSSKAPLKRRSLR